MYLFFCTFNLSKEEIEIMDIWEILGINTTTNIKEIKRAYAKKSKEIHPEENPREFQRLHGSYQAALSYAKLFQSSDIAHSDKMGLITDENSEQNHGELLKYKMDFSSINKEDANYQSLSTNFNNVLKHREIAVKKLEDIFNKKNWFEVSMWTDYLASESFQYVKDNNNFIEYMYYFLNSFTLPIQVAKPIYKALQYDKLKEGNLEKNKLYMLLDMYIHGPIHKISLVKITTFTSFVVALLSLGAGPIINYIGCIFNIITYVFFSLSSKKEIMNYTFEDRVVYESYKQPLFLNFCMVLFIQVVMEPHFIISQEGIIAAIIVIPTYLWVFIKACK